MNQLCSSCYKPEAQHLCSGCRRNFYCNLSCQKVHWEATHQKLCGAQTTTYEDITSLDDLYTELEKKMKQTPHPPEGFVKTDGTKFNQILEEQATVLFGAHQQHLMIQDFWKQAFRMKGVSEAHIGAFERLWKRMEGIYNKMGADRAPTNMGEWETCFDEIDMLTRIISGDKNPVESKLKEDKDEAEFIGFMEWMENTVQRYVDSHPEHRKHKRLPKLEEYFRRAEEQGTFFPSKSDRGAPIGARDTDDESDDPDYFPPKSDDYLTDDEESEGEKEEMIPYHVAPMSMSVLAGSQEEANQEAADMMDGKHKNVRVAATLQEFEDILRGKYEYEDTWKWTRPVMMIPHYLHRASYLRHFIGWIRGRYMTEGVGVLLGVVSMVGILTFPYWTAAVYRGIQNNLIDRISGAFKNITGRVDDTIKNVELNQMVIDDLENTVHRLQALVPEGAQKEAVSKMYWELLASMGGPQTSPDEKRDAATHFLNTMIERFTVSLEGEDKAQFGQGLIDVFQRTVNFLKTSSSSEDIVAQTNAIVKQMNNFYLTGDALNLTLDEQSELAQGILDTQRALADTVAKFAPQLQALRMGTEGIKVHADEMWIAASAANDTFTSAGIQLALKNTDAASWLREYAADNFGFVGKQVLDYMFSPLVAVSRVYDQFYRSREFQMVVQDGGIWAGMATVVQPNFFTVMGVTLLLNHQMLKWAFLALDNLSGAAARYHANRQESILRSLLNNCYVTGRMDKNDPYASFIDGTIQPRPVGKDTLWFTEALSHLSHHRILYRANWIMYKSFNVLHKHTSLLGIGALVGGIAYNVSLLPWVYATAAEPAGKAVVATGEFTLSQVMRAAGFAWERRGVAANLVYEGWRLGSGFTGTIVDVFRHRQAYLTGFSAILGVRRLALGSGGREKRSVNQPRSEKVRNLLWQFAYHWREWLLVLTMFLLKMVFTYVSLLVEDKKG